MAPPGDPTSLLRQAGLRVTRPRVAVLTALEHRPHASCDEVIRAVRAVGTLSTQAGYDVLNTLADRGLVRRIQPAGSVARYELRIGDNHHHLVCRSCGSVTDVDCAVGETPCLVPGDDGGFTVDEAEVTYWGICPSCSAIPGTTA
ncbi:MAG: Fur family transcriptional regulator [Nocardioides sp.]